MPTYDYHCEACGAQFEAFQRMSDPPLETCENAACGAKGKVRRLMGTGAGLIFKGSGFYITDYKDAGKAKPNAAVESCEKAAPVESGAKDGAKSDAPTESKAEAKSEAKSEGPKEPKAAPAPASAAPAAESKPNSAPTAKK